MGCVEVARGCCHGQDKRRNRKITGLNRVTTLHERQITAGGMLGMIILKVCSPTADLLCQEEELISQKSCIFPRTWILALYSMHFRKTIQQVSRLHRHSENVTSITVEQFSSEVLNLFILVPRTQVALRPIVFTM